MQIFQTRKNDNRFAERLSNGLAFVVAIGFGLATLATTLHTMIR